MSLEILEKFIARGLQKKTEEPRLPPKRTANIHAKGENHEIADDILDDIGTSVFLSYKDEDGKISNRRVSICRVSNSKGGNVILSCYCYEAKEPRTFRLDRIIEVVDPETGEIISDHHEILEKFALIARHRLDDPEYATTRALRENRHALNVLVFLGRCDGRLHFSEIDVIFHYLMDVCFEYQIDDEKVRRHINRIYPSVDVYLNSVRKVWDQGKDRYSKVVRYACEMIDADEIVNDDEFKFIQDLKEAKAA